MSIILIVDASESDRRLMTGLLVKSGYEPIAVESMEAAKEAVAQLPPGAVVVSGLSFHGGTAVELINWLKTENLTYPVIAIVDRMDPMVIHDVMKDHGAVEVVQRPALNHQLVDAVKRHKRDDDEIPFSKRKLLPRLGKASMALTASIERAAKTKANIIIFGESGTGKEQIARRTRRICELSNRRNKPVILLEAGGAALVGKYDPSSGNSKMYDRISGYFKKAEGGTIVIKNVQLLSFDKQSVLLHILANERHDVRVICTASSALLQMVEQDEFRDSLFYQLRHTDITVPALRETVEDIPDIAEIILEEYAEETGKPPKRLDASAKQVLKSHLWPGNIRELKYLLKISAYHTQGEILTASNLLFSQSEPEPPNSLRLNDPKTEKQTIINALSLSNGVIAKAAKLLGIARSTLSYKIKQYGLKQADK